MGRDSWEGKTEANRKDSVRMFKVWSERVARRILRAWVFLG